MATIKAQFGNPKNTEKFAKITVSAISVLAIVMTLDVTHQIGSLSGILSLSFLLALWAGISNFSLANKIDANTTAIYASTSVSDIRDRIVTKAAETQTVASQDSEESNLDRVA